ncbi:MAG: tetratricopeptide repeat protein [Limisphaerales bacterium]
MLNQRKFTVYAGGAGFYGPRVNAIALLRRLRRFIAGVAVSAVLLPSVRAAGPDTTAIAQQAVAAYRKGDIPAAIGLATQLTEAAPKQPSGWFLRAQLHTAQRQHAKAVADYSEVIKLDPGSPNAWQARGEANFKLGKITESIADFDKFLELVPAQKPQHWQRGIALYYAGRFKEGREQFEIHQTVNSNDVENAVWHFLCAARADGLEKAKKGLIPIEGDGRVPMAQVHQLFGGKARPEDVLAAAKAAPAETRAGEPLFYAHLYLGIYFEAIGDAKQARDYIFKAAERADRNGYMGDVARVHAEILRKREK